MCVDEAKLAEFPDAAILHNLVGIVQAQLRSLDAAIASFGKALAIKPDFFEAHNNLGHALQHQGRLEDAIASFSEALLIESDDAETHNNLGVALMYKDRLDEAIARFRKAVQSNPRFIEAHSNLCGLYESQNRLDDSPVFLIGFPRSGTTLLETILRSHPRAAIVEEKPMITVLGRIMSKTFGQRPTIEQLNTFSQADVLGWQDIYFKELRKHTDQDGDSKLIIDKYPLNITKVDLINRIFPDAKIILSLRHPCDCVLSCFMQTFRLNDAMASFPES